MQSENMELKSENKRLKEQLQAHNNQNVELRTWSPTDSLQLENGTLKEQLQAQKKEVAGLQLLIDNLQSENKRLKEQLQTQKGSHSDAHHLEDQKVCSLWVLSVLSCTEVPLCITTRAGIKRPLKPVCAFMNTVHRWLHKHWRCTPQG